MRWSQQRYEYSDSPSTDDSFGLIRCAWNNVGESPDRLKLKIRAKTLKHHIMKGSTNQQTIPSLTMDVGIENAIIHNRQYYKIWLCEKTFNSWELDNNDKKRLPVSRENRQSATEWWLILLRQMTTWIRIHQNNRYHPWGNLFSIDKRLKNLIQRGTNSRLHTRVVSDKFVRFYTWPTLITAQQLAISLLPNGSQPLPLPIPYFS